MTGDIIQDLNKVAEPDYWVKNMLQAVLFEDSLQNMCVDPRSGKQTVELLVEVGAHSALAGPIRQILRLPILNGLGISYASCLIREQDATESMQKMVCTLLGSGYRVNLSAVNFPAGQYDLKVVSNLPSYPWNHQANHSYESRLQKSHLFRKYPRHDLLGSYEIGTNPNAPVWRHIIRATEIPWIRDHLVQSDIVYPGAGYISMAIEAARQHLISDGKSVLGYKLRDLHIGNAFVISDTANGTEVQFSLKRCSEKMLWAKDWHEFQVFSVTTEGQWTKHCSGFISVQYETGAANAAGWANSSVNSLSESQADQHSGACAKQVDPNDIYKSLRMVGLYHGQSFQNLLDIQAGLNQSISTLAIADTASIMPSKWESEHVIHPTTLDNVIQAAYTALPGAGNEVTTPMVPQSIQSITVSNRIVNNPGDRLQAYSAIRNQTSQGFDASVFVVNADSSFPVLEISGLHCHSIGTTASVEEDPEAGNLCYKMLWDDDISLLDAERLKEPLRFALDSTTVSLNADLKRACFLFIYDALKSLSQDDIRNLDWHHAKFYQWMLLQEELARENRLGPRSSNWVHATEIERQLLLETVRSASVNGEMVCHVGPKLGAIMRKEIAPLELMLQNKLLYKYYEKDIRNFRSFQQVQKLVKLFSHKYPQAKILEIGAGTGGCTTAVLKALGGGEAGGDPQFAHYDFTDISSGFFEAAREKFNAWGSLINYQKLDVENNPAEQGFEIGSYDLIVACQVLHATKAMRNTMTNVQKLLKPNGKLIVMETTNDGMDMQLVFGCLPGWWLSELF